jgi:hypothetical protein
MDRETLDENKRSGGVLRISCLDFKEMDNPSRIYPCTSIGFLVIAGLGSRHQESANRATVVTVRRERRLDSSGWNSRPGTCFIDPPYCNCCKHCIFDREHPSEDDC